MAAAPSPPPRSLGGLIGYNHQFSPNWVIGLEGEGGWQGLDATNTFISASTLDVIQQNVSTSYSARIRSGLGFAFSDRALLFVGGGVAFTDGGVRLYDVTLGGGVDYAFTPNWIGRVEYLYDNYGARTYRFASLPLVGGASFGNRGLSADVSTIRAALIYRFGAPDPVPVIARY
jgi:outer membrane immunogenic protein